MTSFEVEAIIEIPKGSKLKYEIDKEDGLLSVDRPLDTAIPESYGYILGTLAEDSDQLDVFCIEDEPITPMSKVKITVTAAFICLDNGVPDHKLIGHISGRKTYSYNLDDIEDYLTNYKEGFEVQKLVDAKEAYEIYLKSKN